MNLINNFSDKLMDAIADGLSSKQCFVIFLIWSLLPAFISPPHDFLSWNQYVSQSVIQLVALSALGYNSKKEGKTQRNTIDNTNQIVINELELMKQDAIYEKEEREELKMIIHELSEHVVRLRKTK